MINPALYPENGPARLFLERTGELCLNDGLANVIEDDSDTASETMNDVEQDANG